MRKKTFNNRTVKAFSNRKDKKNYYILLTSFIVLSIFFASALILYNNPVSIDSPSFKPVLRRRMVSVIAMAITSVCQSFATISFQTVTNNRLITPSLIGFDALYSAIHTSIMFFFGMKAMENFTGPHAFYMQVLVMTILSSILYGWLLNSRRKNIEVLLLVGVVFSSGLKSISAFMRRLLTPSEFDVLQARLFGSVNNANSSDFAIALPLVIIAVALIMMNSKKLNVLALGRDPSTNLGLNHIRSTKYILVLSSILISVSTTLVGPITFLGFLVATIIFQIVKTYDHRYILPISACLSFVILSGSYFLMYHVFKSQGVVTIIIEMFGGIAFLILLFRKGNL